MANRKANRSAKIREAAPRRNVRRFPQTKGKIIEMIELSLSSDDCEIDIRFRDKTSLSFSLGASVSIVPELVSWKSGKYKPLKRWRSIQS